MILRQTAKRQSRCIFCSLQAYRGVTTRADLAIPRHNLLEEPITGPIDVKAKATRVVKMPYSSPLSKASLERFKLMQYWARTSGRFGSKMEVSYTPDTAIDDPPAAEEITLELLMASQTHMGHSTSLWNPMNSRYIFGVRQGIHIISLEATASHLKRAARVVEGVAASGGIILFVGTRKGHRTLVTKAAQRAGGCHVFTKWTPGTITNRQGMLKYSVIKAVDTLDREIPGYEEELKEQVAVLKPDLVVCFNPVENKVLLHECGLHYIPSIGIIDTDADPTTVTYPIPANDDSIRSVEIIAGILGKAGEKGQLARLKAAEDGQPLPYKPFNLPSISFSENQNNIDQQQNEPERPRGKGRRGGRNDAALSLSRDLSDDPDDD